MARLPGSIWVSGAYLYHVSATGTTYRCSGSSYGFVSQAIPGSMWVDGAYLYYIDENRYKRRVPRDYRKDTTGVPGSLWIEGNYLHYLASDSDKCRVHQDFTNYSDIPFSNIAHTDKWIGYTDEYFTYHADAYHGDIPHTDHSDVYHYNVPHFDHSDYQNVPHGDITHSDYYDTITNPILT